MRSAIKLFLAELSLKLIPEEDLHDELFNFLWKKSSMLEEKDTSLSSFNLSFVHELSQILGFQPNFNTDGEYFDYRESQFVSNKPTHQDFEFGLNEPVKRFLSGNSLNRNERSKLLNFYLLYFEAQFGGNISRLKSLEVLQAVFA
ncbi:MAG: DNA repair protein RecO C-terminal domain-containing protein [Vicingaceae bacterium]